MKITIDPDIDLIENLELTIKILQAKVKDREADDKNLKEMFIESFKRLEEVNEKVSVDDIKEELEVEDVDSLIEYFKDNRYIYESDDGYLMKIRKDEEFLFPLERE